MKHSRLKADKRMHIHIENNVSLGPVFDMTPRRCFARLGDDECVSEVEEDRDRITHGHHQRLVVSRLTGYNASVAVVEPTRHPKRRAEQ